MIFGHLTWMEGYNSKVVTNPYKEIRAVTYDDRDGSYWSIFIRWDEDVTLVTAALLCPWKEDELFESGRFLPVCVGHEKVAELFIPKHKDAQLT